MRRLIIVVLSLFTAISAFGQTATPPMQANGPFTITVAPVSGAIFGYSPQPVAFGNETVNSSSSPIAVTINSTGSASLVLGTLGTPSSAMYVISSDACSGQTITSGNYCTFNLTFTPTITGLQSATISVFSNAATSPDTISLNGTGVTPIFNYSPSPVAFGNVVTSGSSTKTVTITNTGLGLLILGVLTSSNGLFTISSDTCSSQTLPALTGTCTFNLTFSPTTTGIENVIVTVPDNATNPDLILGSGTGQLPPNITNPTCGTPPCPLPNATSGSPYTFTFAASGGVSPYTWSFTLGTLPSGLILTGSTGVISGTTTVVGTTPLTVKVVDSLGDPGSLTITLTVVGSSGANFYISPATVGSAACSPGLDTNDGTSPTTGGGHGPWATPAHAQLSIRPLLPASLVIQACGGTPISSSQPYNPIPDYYGVSLSLTNLDSGASGKVVTWENYPGESPAFSGGTHITGWTRGVTSGVCTTPNANGYTCDQKEILNTVPYFERIYYNGGDRLRPRLGATATNLIGSYMHATSPYPNGTATSSGAVLTSSSGDGFSALAVNDTLYYTGTCSTPTSCPYTVSSVGTGGTTVTLHTSPPTQATAVNYHAYLGMHYSTAATVNGITNVFPASAYPSCNLATIHGCRLVAFAKWTGDIFPVNLINTTTDVIQTTCGTSCPGEGGPGGPYQSGYRTIFENYAEGLQFGGQWYLDQSTTNPNYPNWTLTYVENPGENANTDVVVVGNNSQVLSAEGLSYWTAQGINFLNDNYTVPAAGYLSSQQQQNLTNAMVACDNCTNVTFNQDIFAQSTTTGLQFTAASANFAVTGNIAYDTGGACYRFGYGPSSTSHTATDTQVPNNYTVSQNWCAGYDRFFVDSYGYQFGLTNTVINSNNDVGYGYNTGVGTCSPGFPGPNQCASQSASNHGDFNLTYTGNDCHNIGEGVTTDLGCYYMMTSFSTSYNLSTTTAPVNVGGSSWQYTFSSTQSGAGSNGWVGGTANLSGFTGSGTGNNGAFPITASTTATITVTNASGTTVNTGTPIVSTTGVASGNTFIANRGHDVNSSAINGDTTDVMGHNLYLDGNTGGWQVISNTLYRQTGMCINMNFGPATANSGNLFKWNICQNSAATPSGTASIRVQTPLNTVLEFTAQSNIFGMALASQLTVNAQTGPPAVNATNFQDFISNVYNYTGTPQFNIVGHSGSLFPTWKGSPYFEDTAGTISTNPGFTASGPCSGGSTVPVLGVCDDFSFLNSTGPGFGFVAVPQTFGPTLRVTMPTVADTFPIATLAPSQFGGAYTLTNQQPYTTAAYSSNADSVTTKKLPADVMQHCYGNTSNCSAGDAIAKCAMTDCGNLSELSNPTYMGLVAKPSPGNNDFGGPFYYSAPTDPWYSATVATPSGAQAITFRAPSGALIGEGVEGSLAIWDQSTGWVVGTYICCGPQTGGGIPVASGCGSTQATACTFSETYLEAASNLFTGQSYGYTPNPSNSAQFAPDATMIRDQELMNGSISHALLVNVDCVNSSAQYVFPSIFAALGVCGTSGFGPQNANRPSGGTLLFCDYTAAQIAGFNLPAWQATILTTFCTYGGYVGGTGGNNVGINIVDGSTESSEAWKYYNSSVGCSSTNCYDNPFWVWAESQKGFNGGNNLSQTGCGGPSGGTNPSVINCEGFFLTNIPRAIGPEGADSEGNSCTTGSGCYPSGHIHVADACVAEGYAGVSGGCN